MFVLIGLLVWGLVESVWGLGQLYNYFPSKHVLFKTTGSFYNPGPYGGFIALAFPLALHYGLYDKKQNKFLSRFSLVSYPINCGFLLIGSTLGWLEATTIIG